MEEWIRISDYCSKCQVEPSFLEMLEEEGLIVLSVCHGERCIEVAQLPDIERYCRLYYDLSINLEGIDVIRQLLARMDRMQQEIDRLQRQLRLYSDVCR